MEAVRLREPDARICPVETESVEGNKKYLVQLMSFDSGIRFSMKILPAFKCPTSPAIYIHVKSYDKIGRSVKFLVITKDTSPTPNLKFINSYAIRLVKNITEGMSIPSTVTTSVFLFPHSYFVISFSGGDTERNGTH